METLLIVTFLIIWYVLGLIGTTKFFQTGFNVRVSDIPAILLGAVSGPTLLIIWILMKIFNSDKILFKKSK